MTARLPALPGGPASRREFLRHLSTAALVSLAAAPLAGCRSTSAAKAQPRPLVGSNIYGWGQYAQRDKKPLDLEMVLSALRDTGYDYLEANLDVNRPEENGRFADRLRAKGLQPVSLYVGARLHEPAQAQQTVARVLAAAKVCQQAGFQLLSCNADPIGREKTDAELQTQAAALEQLGAGLNALGLKLGVHQHLPEMAHQGREFHYDFDHTRSDLVDWCYDVHWVWKGGVMPPEALQEYGQRVVTWHLRQSRNGVWWEDLDAGDVDYLAIARYVREHQLPQRFTVELALEPGTRITRSVVENHRRSREYVRQVFGC